MSANPPKDNSLHASEPCRLYYFPEISGGVTKSQSIASSQGNFVSGTPRFNERPSASDANGPDSPGGKALIEEAFNNGREQGRSEAIAAQQKKIEQAAAALETAVETLAGIRKSDIERMETETVRLALAIAEKVIGHDSGHGQVIRHVVKAAMAKVGDPGHLIMRLNPDDIATVNACTKELLFSDDVGSVLRLEADETIRRGGCLIETKLGDVDARIDRQLQTIAEQLTARLPKHPAGD